MAVTASDGTRHHSASRASYYEKVKADRAGAGSGAAPDNKVKPMDKPADGADGVDGAGKDLSEMDIHDVVAKHGPAHKVHVEHDHDGGSHTVVSHHGPHGHHHKSEHGSAEEAHHHGMAAAGVESSPDEDHETPNEANEAMNDGESGGMSIPGIG